MINRLRNWRLLLSRPWRQPKKLTDVSVTEFRVTLYDIDVNLHLTNTQYPKFLDIGRFRWFFEMGLVPLILRRGLRTVLSSQTVTFIREIKPFSKVRLESRVLYWDRKYFYMEHRFLVKGQLHCKAFARIALLQNGRLKSLDNVMQQRDKFFKRPEREYPTPDLAPEITAKTELLSLMKQAEEKYQMPS